MGTTKGYTGQYNDSLTQLDYYGARYYDPLVGVFLSADSVQGNLAGTDPYSYVGENPETYTDPSGEMYAPPAGAGSLPLPPLPPWQLPGGSQSTQSTQNSNVQPDTCTQMAQAGHPCNVQAAAQGPGQVGEYQRPGLLSMGCVVLLGPCVLLTTSSPERSGPSQGWAYPTFPVNICVPYCTKGDDLSDSEAGGSNGKESDLTKLMDDLTGNLLFAADGGGEGESLGLDENAGDADPLTSHTIEHIFSGEINKHGNAVGYHWEGDPNALGEVVPGTQTPPDARGVYEAQVTISGVRKKGISSFFPESMSAQDVIDSIREAYDNRLYILSKGNSDTYAGETSTGMVVQMFIDPATGQIRSAFPWYEPGF